MKDEKGAKTFFAGVPESDLACERRRADPDVKGILYSEEKGRNFRWERITVTSAEGERQIGRPCGHYDTLHLGNMAEFESEEVGDAGEEIACELCRIFDKNGIGPGRILVVGLGNAGLSPDSVGAKTAERVHATRQIERLMPKEFPLYECSSIATLTPGVLGNSGMEAAEVVAGACAKVRPDAVIAIDALSARSTDRLGRTVQISDTGIFPGSGVGNGRAAIEKKTLGVPVIAVGVPTVVDSRAFFREEIGKLAEKGYPFPNFFPSDLAEGMFVSPREIDAVTDRAADIIAAGINQAFGLI